LHYMRKVEPAVSWGGGEHEESLLTQCPIETILSWVEEILGCEEPSAILERIHRKKVTGGPCTKREPGKNYKLSSLQRIKIGGKRKQTARTHRETQAETTLLGGLRSGLNQEDKRRYTANPQEKGH